MKRSNKLLEAEIKRRMEQSAADLQMVEADGSGVGVEVKTPLTYEEAKAEIEREEEAKLDPKKK